MIFVDSSVWIAAMLDEARAGQTCRDLLRAHERDLATSDAVLTEVWNLLAVRRSPGIATGACLDLVTSVEALPVDAGTRIRAAAALQQWEDQAFSYADALSFALMERHGVSTAFSLDHHFRVFRSGPRRTQTFDVLP